MFDEIDGTKKKGNFFNKNLDWRAYLLTSESCWPVEKVRRQSEEIWATTNYLRVVENN